MPDTPAALLRHLLSESFGDGSQQHSAYDDPRGLLTSRNARMSATDPGTTIGFTYDARGYLHTRQQYLTGQGETFTHDEMGRLTKWESTGTSATWKVEYGYDSIGNLESREESLNGTSQGRKALVSGVTGTCRKTAGPHSVTTVTFAGTTQCYEYDARGQQTVGADQRVVAYTEYGLPTQITRNGVQWQFGYDATHHRATKTGPGGSTIYVGSLYEKRVSTDGTESHVMYVLAGGEVKAQIVVDGTGSGEKIDYVMRDHLGSVTKARGDGAWQDMRFDPYGSRIAPTPPPTPISDSPSSRVRLGFTGQEEDDDLGLVNMNGRIYDPAIARFLTPDPVVSTRSPSQSWNRYSYAENSPLRFVDPSGFIGEDGYGGNGLPPGVHMECTSAFTCGYMTSSGIYLTQDNWRWAVAGNYGTSAVGANVGSFDEAGAGASSVTGGGPLLACSGSDCGAVGNQTLIAYNDIYDKKQIGRQEDVDRNQGDYEASLMRLLAKLTGIDMSDASVRRVLNADQLMEALASGSYSNVIYFGHVDDGKLAPTGPKGEHIGVEDFSSMLGAGVTNVAVLGCRSAGFADQLHELKPGIQTGGMRGDLYARVTNGAITAIWMGTQTQNHVPIVLERYGEIY